MINVYVKLDGVLATPSDPPSNWAIGAVLPHAREVLDFARDLVTSSAFGAGDGEVRIYGAQCQTIHGQRAVQRWMVANELPYDWVTHLAEPPTDEPDPPEVIDKWPMNS